MKGNKTSDPLPEDLVRNILSRLSVKMLCRCKLVCKEWCGLIQCPDFVKQHFYHESNPDRLLMGCFSLSLAGTFPIENTYLLSIDDSFTIFEELRYLHMMLSTHLWGPLNGVYLVVSSRWPFGPAGLLNPATRQFKPLHLFEHKELQQSRVIYDENSFDFGLGLDHVTGDFKLVLISFCFQLVALCTSDDDYESWRFLDGVKPRCGVLTSRTANTYLNGKLYWLLDYKQSVDVVVLAFDMWTEKFREIKVVSCDENKWGWGLLAVNRDSSLVLVMEGVDKRSLSVWTMLEEGCWITSAIMVLPDIICGTRPLYFWKNDEFLLNAWGTRESGGDEALISYNVRSQKLWGPIIARSTGPIIEHLRFYRYHKYKESLVSLKGKRGNYMFWDPFTLDYIQPFFK